MKFSRHDIFKNVAWLGLTLAAAASLRYLIRESADNWTKWLLIAGVALFLLGAGFNYRSILAWFTRRSTRLGANTLALGAAVLALLSVANLLAVRHPKRWDMTEEQLHSLSDQTRKIVAGLKTDVTIIKFDQREDTRLRDLMAEYKSLSGRIHYQFVDPQERPDLAKQHGIERFGETIAVAGTRTERVNDSTEQDITNALLKLTRESTRTVCFVEGHGEKSTSSTEEDGLSGAEEGLKRENYTLKNVNLATGSSVPTDCSLLVVAGPKREFLAPEADLLKNYLDAGGKVMLLLDPDTRPGLDALLAAWKVELGNNTVVDVSGVGRLFGMGPAVPLVIEYGDHPVTKDFDRSMTLFPLARSVRAASSGDASVTVVDLLKTSSESWAETQISGGLVRYDEGKDLRGPVTLGVAAWKKVGEKEARLIVIGDSDFASNRFLGAQLNRDLFVNAVNWLSQDEELIAVRPKSPKSRRVTLTQSQQNLLSWFSVILLPGAVLLAGAVIWWRRR